MQRKYSASALLCMFMYMGLLTALSPQEHSKRKWMQGQLNPAAGSVHSPMFNLPSGPGVH